MDTLDNEFNVQEETKQMKKLQMYQKLVFFTLLKYKWSILLVFVLTVLLGCAARYFQFKYSHHKFEGSVTLFYTPRASEEVKPLSINHVLGVFSRQQIFHQLVEEMHLTEKQKSVLKQCIEVKLLKDQNDMFIITGVGGSEEYVKQLVKAGYDFRIASRMMQTRKLAKAALRKKLCGVGAGKMRPNVG